MDATAGAFLVPVLAKPAPETRHKALREVTGGDADPRVCPGILMVPTHEADGVPVEAPLEPAAGVLKHGGDAGHPLSLDVVLLAGRKPFHRGASPQLEGADV